MSGGTRLETNRLIIREFEGGDWKAIHEYASDPEVVKFMEWGPSSEAQTREFVGEAIASSGVIPRINYHLVVALRDSGRIIGSGRIGISNPANRGADIGYSFRRDEWGKGYGTESAVALLAFGFESLKMHRIMATTHPLNKASGRVLEKSGFRYEGRRREDKLVRGEWRDTLVFSILEQDWANRKKG